VALSAKHRDGTGIKILEIQESATKIREIVKTKKQVGRSRE